ncbi:MAG: class IV adenylate cyclase [Planctomycetota bacterium]|jgi:adenylate cyclase class 2
MGTEIEAKLKVDSHVEIVRNLEQCGGEFAAEHLQTDVYFDDANRTLTKTDRCLRLRRETVGEAQRILLTYKGPKQVDDFKKREQIEIELSGADSAGKLLSALGYEEALTFEKKRRMWHLGECEVALDQLPLLGSFVEIEGPDGDKIAEAKEKLRLGHLAHIADSYACLVQQKLREETAE